MKNYGEIVVNVIYVPIIYVLMIYVSPKLISSVNRGNSNLSLFWRSQDVSEDFVSEGFK